MIRFPKTVDEALSFVVEDNGVYRAGGTDLQALRLHLPLHSSEGKAPPFAGPIVDLRDVPGLDSVAHDETGAWIGCLTTLATISEHPVLHERWPGFAEACALLISPIRTVATLGGNIMQAPRCWYYRHPDYDCLRKGGKTCFAREGDHLWHVAFDTSPCAAPHASSVAMVLLAYEAEVEYLTPGNVEPQRVPIADVLGWNALVPGALLTTVRLGPPVGGERNAYVRASNRAYGEWALVEVCARLVIDASTGQISFARVAAGAVAPTPIRLTAVEEALVGAAPEPEVLAKAAALAKKGAKPLPMTGYKLDLLEGSVLTALERALEDEPTAASGVSPEAQPEAKPEAKAKTKEGT